MVASDKFTAQKILWLHRWTPELFSFRLTRHAGFRFVPGQFARLGVVAPDPDNPHNPSGQKIVWRAYSVVSATYDEHLEFYSVVVPGGEFTSQLTRLQVGDAVYVERASYGFMTRERFEPGADLWLLATGTGLAPYLSLLWEFSTWQDYENIVLVHSVRRADELAYADTIAGFARHDLFAAQAHKLAYVPVVTREPAPGALTQRIPALLASGALEQRVGLPLTLARSRIMMCGNPEAVDQTRQWLQSRGFATSRRGKPGQLALENYW